MTTRKHYPDADSTISHGVWRYPCISLNVQYIERLSAERGIDISRKTIQQECPQFEPRHKPPCNCENDPR